MERHLPHRDAGRPHTPEAITAAGNILWERARKYANAIASVPGGEPMRSVTSRLARLERLDRLSTAPRRFRVQWGYLKTLPDDYVGPRHVATVRQLPPVERGEGWYEWEERPGPEPVSNATGPDDEILVQVHYVEGKAKA